MHTFITNAVFLLDLCHNCENFYFNMGVIRIVFSTVSSVLGYSSFIAFMVLKNYPAAVLSLISGSTDACLCLLHYLDYKRHLLIWYDRNDLRRFCRGGILVASIGILCIGYYATIQIMLNKPMLPIPDSGVIPLVWSIVVLRSGILLIYYGFVYQIHNNDTHQIINASNDEE